MSWYYKPHYARWQDGDDVSLRAHAGFPVFRFLLPRKIIRTETGYEHHRLIGRHNHKWRQWNAPHASASRYHRLRFAFERILLFFPGAEWYAFGYLHDAAE